MVEIILTQKVGIYNMTLFGWFFAFTLFLSEIHAAWVLQRASQSVIDRFYLEAWCGNRRWKFFSLREEKMKKEKYILRYSIIKFSTQVLYHIIFSVHICIPTKLIQVPIRINAWSKGMWEKWSVECGRLEISCVARHCEVSMKGNRGCGLQTLIG